MAVRILRNSTPASSGAALSSMTSRWRPHINIRVSCAARRVTGRCVPKQNIQRKKQLTIGKQVLFSLHLIFLPINVGRTK